MWRTIRASEGRRKSRPPHPHPLLRLGRRMQRRHPPAAAAGERQPDQVHGGRSDTTAQSLAAQPRIPPEPRGGQTRGASETTCKNTPPDVWWAMCPDPFWTSSAWIYAMYAADCLHGVLGAPAHAAGPSRSLINTWTRGKVGRVHRTTHLGEISGDAPRAHGRLCQLAPEKRGRSASQKRSIR